MSNVRSRRRGNSRSRNSTSCQGKMWAPQKVKRKVVVVVDGSGQKWTTGLVHCGARVERAPAQAKKSARSVYCLTANERIANTNTHTQREYNHIYVYCVCVWRKSLRCAQVQKHIPLNPHASAHTYQHTHTQALAIVYPHIRLSCCALHSRRALCNRLSQQPTANTAVNAAVLTKLAKLAARFGDFIALSFRCVAVPQSFVHSVRQRRAYGADLFLCFERTFACHKYIYTHIYTYSTANTHIHI